MNTLIDSRDKREYQTIKIGNQTWMAENLDFVTNKGSCYSCSNQDNCQKLGRLYDWETALKAVPPGCRLPNQDDFTNLIEFLGGDILAYDKLAQGGSSGFNAVISEWRDSSGYFNTVQNFTQSGEESEIQSIRFWSATKCDSDSKCKDHAHYFSMVKILYGNYSSSSNVYVTTREIYPMKSGFFNVRCIKA